MGNERTCKKMRDEMMLGQTSGLLTVIAQAEKPQDGEKSVKGSWWLCRCSCGRERILPRNYIKQGYAKSCGMCKKKDCNQKKREKHKTEKTMVLFCEKLARDETCEKCKKAFGRTSSEWAYKALKGNRKQVWFCSYSCMRAWQRGGIIK